MVNKNFQIPSQRIQRILAVSDTCSCNFGWPSHTGWTHYFGGMQLGFPSGIGQKPHLCCLMWGSKGQGVFPFIAPLGCACSLSISVIRVGCKASGTYLQRAPGRSHLVPGWSWCLILLSGSLTSYNPDFCSLLKEESLFWPLDICYVTYDSFYVAATLSGNRGTVERWPRRAQRGSSSSCLLTNWPSVRGCNWLANRTGIRKAFSLPSYISLFISRVRQVDDPMGQKSKFCWGEGKRVKPTWNKFTGIERYSTLSQNPVKSHGLQSPIKTELGTVRGYQACIIVRTRVFVGKEKKPRRSQGQLSELLIFTNLIINEYHVSEKNVKRIIVFQGLENC